MEKLMKPVEYAKELGISRQAVYAKIKRGILTAKNVEGKLYIVVDTNEEEKLNSSTKKDETPTQEQNTKPTHSSKKDYKALLLAKDETISVLKETVSDLKESNKQISTTLRGEIDLLKEAFHEMRSLYALQLKHRQEETIEVISNNKDDHTTMPSVDVVEEQWVSLKKFLKNLGVEKKRHQKKILKQLKKDYKLGKEYIAKKDGKFKIDLSKNYEGILK